METTESSDIRERVRYTYNIKKFSYKRYKYISTFLLDKSGSVSELLGGLWFAFQKTHLGKVGCD